MKRYTFKDEDKRLWSLVTSTVRPRVRVLAPTLLIEPQAIETAAIATQSPAFVPMTPFIIGAQAKPEPAFKLKRPDAASPNTSTHEPIEPKRKRRLSRERDPIEARLDLHGLSSFAAEIRLKRFIAESYAQDYRAVLIITGKGMAENGILKRNAPYWLADPHINAMVAGISQAHARHGGSGALYVALKRRKA
jgi:DNA-nicking Smr family endonuclease